MKMHVISADGNDINIEFSSFETPSDMQLRVQCTHYIRAAAFVCRQHRNGSGISLSIQVYVKRSAMS